MPQQFRCFNGLLPSIQHTQQIRISDCPKFTMKKTLTAPERYLSYSTLLKRGRARVHIAGDVLGDGVETKGADLLKVQPTTAAGRVLSPSRRQRHQISAWVSRQNRAYAPEPCSERCRCDRESSLGRPTDYPHAPMDHRGSATLQRQPTRSRAMRYDLKVTVVASVSETTGRRLVSARGVIARSVFGIPPGLLLGALPTRMVVLPTARSDVETRDSRTVLQVSSSLPSAPTACAA
jgi:hypothetical protein